jgi:hypothetical protein
LGVYGQSGKESKQESGVRTNSTPSFVVMIFVPSSLQPASDANQTINPSENMRIIGNLLSP